MPRGLPTMGEVRLSGIFSPETVKTRLQRVSEHEGVHGRMALLAAVPR